MGFLGWLRFSLRRKKEINMGKNRAPGKPFSPGNEAANKKVKKVLFRGEKVIHYRYLVISDCCGAEQDMSHDALRRIETTGKGTMCHSCCSKEKVRIDREQRRAEVVAKAERRRKKLDLGSHEWAQHLLCHTAFFVSGPEPSLESWR